MKKVSATKCLGNMTTQDIGRVIFQIRGEKVMIDQDLAKLYGVSTKVLLQALKRNIDRFPVDFMFQLTNQEVRDLRSQIVTSRLQEPETTAELARLGATMQGYGGRRYNPYVFSEQGVAMLSSVLTSPRAVAVNIEIMRTFVQLRRMALTDSELARKLNFLEKKYDSQFKTIFEAIRQLILPDVSKKRPIGFGRE